MVAVNQVYASLGNWASGSCKTVEFDMNTVSNAYQTNIAILEAIKDTSVKKYHTLMHGLFKKVRYVRRRLLFKLFMSIDGFSQRPGKYRPEGQVFFGSAGLAGPGYRRYGGLRFGQLGYISLLFRFMQKD